MQCTTDNKPVAAFAQSCAHITVAGFGEPEQMLKMPTFLFTDTAVTAIIILTWIVVSLQWMQRL